MQPTGVKIFERLSIALLACVLVVSVPSVAFAQIVRPSIQTTRPSMPTSTRVVRRAFGAQPTFNPVLTDIPIYNVYAYGNANTCSGPSNDDYAAINAAITDAQNSGGPAIVLIPYQHCYLWGETLKVTASNIHVRGISNGVSGSPGTEISWDPPHAPCGPGTGPMVSFGSTLPGIIESSDLSDIYLDGGGGNSQQPPCADKGITITSVVSGQWNNISGNVFSQFFIECTAFPSNQQQYSSIHNTFNDINIVMNYNSSSNKGVGIFFTAPANQGSIPTDCNQNLVENSYIQTWNGAGALFWTADHNVLFNDQFYVNPGYGATGGGVVFGCGSAFNIGYTGDPASIVSNGTTACGAGNEAKFNRWVDLPCCLPIDPSSSLPVTQPGARFTWTDNQGGTHSAGP